TSPILTQQSATSTLSASSLTALTTYYWRVRAQNSCGWGDWSTVRFFVTLCSTPAVPTLVGPANGATGVTVPAALDWADVSGATNYQVQVDNDSNYSSTLIDQQSATSTYAAASLVDATMYYWRVRAQNGCGWGAWSSSRVFTTPCVAPIAPTLASPANGAPNLAQPISLDWNDIATATNYQVQIDNNSDFTSVTLDQQSAASTFAASGLATDGTTYYWRVRAQSVCGWGPWSASRFFSTVCTLPAVPSFVSPANGATNLSQPIVLDWSNVSGATLYQVQVDNDSDFSSVATDQQPGSSTYSVTGLSSGTLFYWRIRSQNGCGWGAWSASRTFNTVGVDVTPPTISNVAAINVTDSSALITWTTNELSTGLVNYGNSASYGSSSPLNSTLLTDHEQLMSGLTAEMDYHFRVRSSDGAGNESVSGDFTFTTSEVLNNLDNGVPPTVSSTYSGYSSTRITDGVIDPFGGTASTWASTESSTQPHWVEVDFGSSRKIKRVLVYWAWNAGQGTWMTSQEFRLQAWNGTAYTDVATVSNATIDSCSFVDIAPVTTSRLRYFQPANMGPATYPSVVWVSEMDVFGLTNTAPSVPNLSSPAAGGQVGTLTPTLVLSNSSDPENDVLTYNIQVSTSATFSTITAQASGIAEGSGTTSWAVNTNLVSGTTYYWRARSFDGFLYSNYSASRTFNVSVNSAPSVPTLASPIGGSQVGSLTPTLTINNSTDAEGNTIIYDFQVSTTSGFAAITAQANGVAQGGSGVTSWVVGTNLTNGNTYYWRSRAYDGALYSSYSAAGSFVVGTNSAPTVPTLSSPSAGGQVATLTPTLTIGNSTDAEGNTITCHIQVSTSSSFASIVAQASGLAQGGGGVTSWVVTPNLATGTTYYWRARSYDGALYSNYAAYRTFSVVTNSAPSTPTLSSPAAASQVLTLTPALVVNNATDPDGNLLTYEFQVATSSAFTNIVAQVNGVSQGTGATAWTVTPDLNYATTYYWRARAFDGALYSGYAAYRSFTVFNNTPPGAPSPQLPLNGSRVIDFTPDLVVANATDANGDDLSYQFYLYNEATTVLLAQSPMLSQGTGTTVWTSTLTLAPKTKYTWRARANDGTSWSNYSVTRNFRTNRIPLTPIPTAPIDGDTVIGSMHQYVVLNASDPDGDSLTYNFEVYSDSLLTILVESVLGVAPGSSQTSATSTLPLIPNQFYWWRARANDSTHSSEWCEAEKFFQSQISLDVTEAPSIVAPAPGDEVDLAQPMFTISWTGTADSSICLFELSRTSTFETLVDAGSVYGEGNSASWTTDKVLDQGEYYWRAQRGNSDYSITANFSIVASIYVSPNPFEYSHENIVVHNLPAGSRFEVYTSSGDQVMSIENLSGDFNWDVRNSSGEKLGSGVFLWYVHSSDKTISGKLIVQR
ncbi:MAG: discoidin domain-containing protein, partial [Candidatus Zixiibacteriota bacterium]